MILRSFLLGSLILLLCACGAGAVRWNPDVHVVRKGETLYSIAWRHGVDYRNLAAWNGIKSGYVIYPGQKLSLKKGRTSVSSTAVAKKTPSTASSSRRRTVVRPAAPAPAKSNIKWQWPTQGQLIAGFNDSNATGKGIDVGGSAGQAVVAAATGKVVYSGSGLIGYGKIIIVKHSEHFLSAYGHNSKLLVREGQEVKAGQKLATMGQGPGGKALLHFEIRFDGQAVDPAKYLPTR